MEPKGSFPCSQKFVTAGAYPESDECSLQTHTISMIFYIKENYSTKYTEYFNSCTVCDKIAAQGPSTYE